MREKHVLIISSVFLFVLGVVLLIVPEEIFSLLNIKANSALFARLLGAVFIGFALLNWFTRNLAEHKLKPIILANLAFYLLGFVVMLVNYLVGAGTENTWLASGLFLLMAIAFGYAYCCLQVWDYLTGKFS